MPLTKAVITQPIFEQSKTYAAQDDRRAYADYASAGVVGVNDFLVTTAGGLAVSAAAGAAWVVGGSVADQGAYRVYHGSATGLTCGANSSVNRIDSIVLRIMDSTHDGTGLQEANLAIVPGTPNAAATLANPLGAADLTNLTTMDQCKAYILLAYVLVPGPSGAATVGDKRSRALLGAGALKSSTTGIGQTLPPSPGDGDEYYYIVDATFGVYWHLKWSVAINAWMVIGGEELISFVGAASPTIDGNFFYTGCQVFVPLAGEYIARWGVNHTANNSVELGIAPRYGGSGPTISEGANLLAARGGITGESNRKALAAGANVDTWMWSWFGTAGVCTYNYMYLRVRPVRIYDV